MSQKPWHCSIAGHQPLECLAGGSDVAKNALYITVRFLKRNIWVHWQWHERRHVCFLCINYIMQMISNQKHMMETLMILFVQPFNLAICRAFLSKTNRTSYQLQLLFVEERGAWNLRLGDVGLAVPLGGNGELEGTEAPAAVARV